MDIASLAGIILGAVMFVFGVFSNGGFEAFGKTWLIRRLSS